MINSSFANGGLQMNALFFNKVKLLFNKIELLYYTIKLLL